MSNNWAQVPGYWVKNIDKFKNILESGSVYFDLIEEQQHCVYNVYICDVKLTNKKHKERRLRIFTISKIDIEKMFFIDLRVGGSIKFPQVGDFWEPSVLATALTCIGIEVYYGIDKTRGTEKYLSYTGALSCKSFDHGTDEEMRLIVGTSENFAEPPVKKLPENKNRVSVFKDIDLDDF